MSHSYTLLGAQIFTSGKPSLADIKIENNSIVSVSPSSNQNATEGNTSAVSLGGKKLYPGFFNSHDHLLASYLPKVGGSTKHNSWLAFDNLYKSSGVFAERQQLESELLYFLGSYKNLIAGVTSVFDHIPHQVQAPFVGNLPVRLISEYTLSHSLGNYSLGWGEGPALEYRIAESTNKPFVTHLGEGLDEDSLTSLKRLEKAEALGPHSVLVHCLPFGPREVEKIAKANASVVWCPTSNLHIFGKTTNIKLFLEAGVNVCLGTDFSPSGSLHLMEEMKLAKTLYQDLYEEELQESVLLDWVTKNPAKAFRQNLLGEIKEGNLADLLVLEDEDSSKNEISVSQLNPGKIDLMIVDGSPILASPHYKKLFSDLEIDTETISLSGKDKIVAGSPKRLLEQVSASVGYKKELAFLPIF